MSVGTSAVDKDKGWVEVVWDGDPTHARMSYRWHPKVGLMDVIPWAPLTPGDRVRVYAGCTPASGWGNAAPGDVGAVTAFCPSTHSVTVDFPAHKGWKGLLFELQRL